MRRKRSSAICGYIFTPTEVSACGARFAPADHTVLHSARRIAHRRPGSGRCSSRAVRSADAALLLRCRFGRRRTGQCSVEFLDSAALCLDADKQEDEDREKKPNGKIVEARNDRVDGCLRVDVIGGAGDHRETGRTNEFADVTRPINEAETARAQRRRPQLGHVRKHDRKPAVGEEAVDQQEDVEY